MEEIIVRKLMIEYLENVYHKPYTETCLGNDFDLKFISTEKTEQKYRNRAIWIASFYLDLDIVEEDRIIEFFPTLIEIFLDDETGEIWKPFESFKKLTAQEKRAARKERRQARRRSIE